MPTVLNVAFRHILSRSFACIYIYIYMLNKLFPIDWRNYLNPLYIKGLSASKYVSLLGDITV